MIKTLAILLILLVLPVYSMEVSMINGDMLLLTHNKKIRKNQNVIIYCYKKPVAFAVVQSATKLHAIAAIRLRRKDFRITEFCTAKRNTKKVVLLNLDKTYDHQKMHRTQGLSLGGIVTGSTTLKFGTTITQKLAWEAEGSFIFHETQSVLNKGFYGGVGLSYYHTDPRVDSWFWKGRGGLFSGTSEFTLIDGVDDFTETQSGLVFGGMFGKQFKVQENFIQFSLGVTQFYFPETVKDPAGDTVINPLNDNFITAEIGWFHVY